MLILTRKIGQKIIIAENIHIELLRINGNSAAIGIKAPEEITIHREEVWSRLQQHDINTDP